MSRDVKQVQAWLTLTESSTSSLESNSLNAAMMALQSPEERFQSIS